ncbi:hypothetical protein PMIN06_000976 [Paraphaeosphaeria minitans]|uniref:cutinase n=1 Tax=Paraphaeosphaeria minitans TaxID=565426 RepID=A0A9P6GP86_9PLEO|nr:cutinase [Paraphaeosphaeria minitans]
MISLLALPLALLLPLATSSPHPNRRTTYGPSNATDIDAVLAGSRSCSSSGVVIVRETWAPGNIGVLWGARFRDEMVDAFGGDVDVQGVHREDYPANLEDYHIGGSDTGADSCARMVEAYAGKCPDARVFVTGYSQGSLVAYKCVNRVSAAARAQVKALVVFGSEERLMDDVQPVPEGILLKDYCVENTTAPDVVCTQTLTSGIQLPTSVGEIVSQLEQTVASLGELVTNEDQLKEVATAPALLIRDLPATLPWIAQDIEQGKIRRWLILPPHLMYGFNGMTTDAAAWMASVAGS